MSDSKRTLMVVSGGVEALPGIERAHQLGLHVVVSDGAPDAPGFGIADDHLVASTYDVDATVAAAVDFSSNVRPIDGVICVASDVPVTVAAVAAELNLVGVPLESARIVADKVAMKERFADAAIPIPWFAELESAEDLATAIDEKGFPLVVKPVDSRGARGVLLLKDSSVDPAWAFKKAQSESPSCRVMVEQFLDGPQVSTESLVIDGETHTIGLADRNYEYLDRFAPYIIENGGQLPTSRSGAECVSIRSLIQRTAESLGVRDGVIKGDVVIHSGEAKVIEVALRLSGGYLCSHEIPLSTGVDFLGAAIRIALGDSPTSSELLPTSNRGVAQRWLFPEPGLVLQVTGVDEVRARPEVDMCEIRVLAGDVVTPAESHPARAGVVIATGETRDEAVASAARAVDAINIETTSS